MRKQTLAMALVTSHLSSVAMIAFATFGGGLVGWLIGWVVLG